MSDAKHAVVRANYALREGLHVFTSPDLPGLCVASRDPSTAVENAIQQIRDLIKFTYNVDCQVTAAHEFPNFVAWSRQDHVSDGPPVPEQHMPERFVVQAA